VSHENRSPSKSVNGRLPGGVSPYDYPMTTWIALLRAVNVGGTGKLPMADLRTICGDAGFGAAQTCIASGNVVFESSAKAAAVQAALEQRLMAYSGKPVGVLLRTAAELRAVRDANPYPGAAPNRVYTIFLAEPPPEDAAALAVGVTDEQLRLGRREIYVYYPGGMGESRLRIPAAKSGTARNMNTVAKLVEMAARR
jgi:uncharacterized protein (DUF1697 family)